MALQDLTPQLRTRLSRMERAVGWFVILAVILLGCGFVYYVYTTADRKGWFVTKAKYFTFLESAAGLKPGDSVKLMGFDVGQITRIDAQPPWNPYDVYVEFDIKAPYYGYLWTTGSVVRVASASLLGSRELEVTKGTGGYASYIFSPLREINIGEIPNLPDLTDWVLAQEIMAGGGTKLLGKPRQPLTNLTAFAQAGYTNVFIMNTNKLFRRKFMTGVWNPQERRYDFYTAETKFWLHSEESPTVTEQLQAIVGQVQDALPGILQLTNQLAVVLSNSAELTSNLNSIAVAAGPIVTNIAAATAHLDQPGALGEWLLPTNVNRQLESTLTNANLAVASANTNLTMVFQDLDRTLDNLASITSNLNHQVAINTNLVSSLSDAIVHADEFVQGLKRFWLFRHLFKNEATNAPPHSPRQPLVSPKHKDGS